MKEDFLKNIKSPIIKGIIKKFWALKVQNNVLEIRIESEINYNIIKKEENQKELNNIISKNYPEVKFEVKKINKEENIGQNI